MNLTESQSKAVTELVNIAFARAGAALAELAGNGVDLTAPEARTYPIAELGRAIGRFFQGDVATVHQVFGGAIVGDALLVLDVDGAQNLARVLTDVDSPTGQLTPLAADAIAEVGNIMLNACLGVFGEILKARLTFAVPRLRLDSLDGIHQILRVGEEPVRHALVVGARFEVRQAAVLGCVVLVLGVTSLEKFVREVEEWAVRSPSMT